MLRQFLLIRRYRKELLYEELGMRIELSEEIRQYLVQLIQEGRFEDESAAIETALRQMRNRADKRDALRKAMLSDESVEPLAFRG